MVWPPNNRLLSSSRASLVEWISLKETKAYLERKVPNGEVYDDTNMNVMALTIKSFGVMIVHCGKKCEFC